MKKLSVEARLVTPSTPEERLQFMLDTFSGETLLEVFKVSMGHEEIDSEWVEPLDKMLNCLIGCYVINRDKKKISASGDLSKYKDLKSFVTLASGRGSTKAMKDLLHAYLESIPQSGKKDKEKSQEAGHKHLMLMLDLITSRIIRRLHNHEMYLSSAKKLNKGDVVAEGPGFEVVVGNEFKNHIRYPENNSAVILMHDTRDGHFLILERFNSIDGEFILELPKVRGSLKDTSVAASIMLRDDMGLTLRDVEKIGEIRPDTQIVDGVCDVYYGNFDLEESYKPISKEIRDIKRITEEGIYQCAFDGRITCSWTLSAMAIWRAFESVRKKRVANSRRVRIKPGDEDE